MKTKKLRAKSVIWACIIAVGMIAALGAGNPVLAAEGTQMKASIEVNYAIKGNPAKSCKASFTLRAAEKGTPMPDGCGETEKKITIEGPGKVSFGEIYYSVPDVYKYEVVRSGCSADDVKVDDSVFEIEVAALSNGHTDQIIKKKGENGKVELRYEDVPKETPTTEPPTNEPTVNPPAETNPPEAASSAANVTNARTGDSFNPIIAGMTAGVAFVILLYLLTRGRRKKLDK